MLNRWCGIVLISVMLIANVSLLSYDIIPVWFATDPPPSDRDLLYPGQKRTAQVSIFDAAGRHIGQSWTEAERVGEVVNVRSLTMLDSLGLPNGISTPPVRIAADIQYGTQPGQGVQDVSFVMYGLPVVVKLAAEAMPSGDFPVKWEFGDQKGEGVLNSDVPQALGDVIRPFDQLPELYVGRTWRVRIFSPLAQLLPGLPRSGPSFDAEVVRVTGTELIEHDGKPLDAFVVRSDNATAWVAPDGRVLRQEVKLPVVGKITLLHETFDADALRRARISFHRN